MKKIFKVLSLVLIAGLLFSPNLVLGQFDFMKNGLIGKKAPNFSLETLNSGKVNFNEYRGEDKAIIFFWATWCPHCRVQLDSLDKQSAELKENGIKLAAIDFAEDKATVVDYVRDKKIGVEVFLDSDGSLSTQYGLIGVPTFFFIGPDGVVKDVTHSLPEKLDGIF